MRRSVLVLVVFLAGVAGACGSASGSRAACGPAGVRVLAADGVARVYQHGGQVLACVAGRHGSVVIGATRTCVRSALVQRVALAGATLAAAIERCGVDTGSTRVEVLKLRQDRVVASAPATSVPSGPEAYTTVTALAVREDGAAAWIASARSIMRSASSLAVLRLAGGRLSELDSGPRIAPGSLRLERRGRVSWRDGGRTRSAVLR